MAVLSPEIKFDMIKIYFHESFLTQRKRDFISKIFKCYFLANMNESGF